MENYFFELAIYRCTKEKYYDELNQLRKKIDLQIPNVKGYEESIAESKEILFHSNSYDYEYNEIIGWINLYVFGNQIRGTYHFEVDPNSDRRRTKKRINKGIRRKKFEIIGKAFELTFYKEDTSEEIYSQIINEIKYLEKNEKPFKGRYIDIRKLEEISKFVDWKGLLLGLNPF